MKRELCKNRKRRVDWLPPVLIALSLLLLSQPDARPSTAKGAAEGEVYNSQSTPPPVYYRCFSSSFGFNATKPNDYNCLKEIAEKLKGSNQWVVIDGHRDMSEDSGVSLARANNARNYLVNELGIDASRIVVRTFCFSCPGDVKIGNRRIDAGMVPDHAALPEDFVIFECAHRKFSPRTCKEEPPRKIS